MKTGVDSVEPNTPIYSQADYDALQSLNAELLEELESICLMQALNYGDATKTHLDLPELTDKVKAVIAKTRNAQ